MLAPRVRWIFAAAVIAAVALGCSSKKSDDKPDNPPAKKDARAPVKTPDAAVAAGDGDGDGDGDVGGDPFAAIGVEPCDDYITRQKSCVESHAPVGIKDQQLDGLAHIATRWRRAAAAGATEHLQQSCEALLSASADATAAWTCKW